MAGAALAKGAGAPHEYATAMPQRAIERLDHPRAGLAHDVGRGGRHLRVGAPAVGKVARVPPVALKQRPLQMQERGRAARAQHPGYDAPRRALDGQPQPDLARPLADKLRWFI